jgi:putative protease
MCQHDDAEAIGRVAHYYSGLRVAAVNLDATLHRGDRVHIRGHTTDLVEIVTSMEVAHRQVEVAGRGEDVAIRVDDRVREHDRIFRE